MYINTGTCLFQAEASRSLTKHRKIASSFRDTQLFDIFQLGCSLLKKASDAVKTIDFSDADQVSCVSCAKYRKCYFWYSSTALRFSTSEV